MEVDENEIEKRRRFKRREYHSDYSDEDEEDSDDNEEEEEEEYIAVSEFSEKEENENEQNNNDEDEEVEFSETEEEKRLSDDQILIEGQNSLEKIIELIKNVKRKLSKIKITEKDAYIQTCWICRAVIKELKRLKTPLFKEDRALGLTFIRAYKKLEEEKEKLNELNLKNDNEYEFDFFSSVQSMLEKNLEEISTALYTRYLFEFGLSIFSEDEDEEEDEDEDDEEEDIELLEETPEESCLNDNEIKNILNSTMHNLYTKFSSFVTSKKICKSKIDPKIWVSLECSKILFDLFARFISSPDSYGILSPRKYFIFIIRKANELSNTLQHQTETNYIKIFTEELEDILWLTSVPKLCSEYRKQKVKKYKGKEKKFIFFLSLLLSLFFFLF